MSNLPDSDKMKSNAKQGLDKAMQLVSQSPFVRQLVTGTASGWVTGLLTRNVGKPMAIGVGGGVILWHIAEHKGYISGGLSSLKQAAEEKLQKPTPQLVNKVKMFASKNRTFTLGFIGGFLIGIAL